jgi:hypothetical protein
LRAELELAAHEENRKLSDKVRDILINYAADRAARREQAVA